MTVLAESNAISTITSAMTTAFTSIVGDMMTTIGGILPIVLPVVGAVAVIFLGVRLFKRLSKKNCYVNIEHPLAVS